MTKKHIFAHIRNLAITAWNKMNEQAIPFESFPPLSLNDLYAGMQTSRFLQDLRPQQKQAIVKTLEEALPHDVIENKNLLMKEDIYKDALETALKASVPWLADADQAIEGSITNLIHDIITTASRLDSPTRVDSIKSFIQPL